MAEIKSVQIQALNKRYTLFIKGAAKAIARANLPPNETSAFMESLGRFGNGALNMLLALDTSIHEQEVRSSALRAAKARTANGTVGAPELPILDQSSPERGDALRSAADASKTLADKPEDLKVRAKPK